jgi:hypothetical protein
MGIKKTNYLPALSRQIVVASGNEILHQQLPYSTDLQKLGFVSLIFPI